MPRDAGPALHELQRQFAGALRIGADEGVAASGTPGGLAGRDADERLAVYRNNTRQFFRHALALTYPVLRRRVGEGFFHRLADEYRVAHPSRSGDLHWVGAHFPEWLHGRLAQGEYVWLADLARLEWACEEALTAAHLPHVPVETLAGMAAEDLDGTTLQLQPSLRLVASHFPIGTVWQVNQGDDPAGAVDLAAGAEHCVCACTDERVAVYRLDAPDHAALGELVRGACFASALATTGAEPAVLARLLGWAFSERLVTAVNPCARA